MALLVVTALPSTAQHTNGDAVLAGYMRLYSSDREAGFKQFETLHALDPQSLPKWFGLLFAHNMRLELDDSLMASFERSIADFLYAAEQRYNRSKADAEALFYLQQGYLLRSTFRVNHDKGIFGAARDAAKSKNDKKIVDDFEHEAGSGAARVGLISPYRRFT